MATPAKVGCPRCGRKQQRQASADALYWCSICRGYYDAQPDEGGDYSDRNPAARIEREERQRSARAGRRR